MSRWLSYSFVAVTVLGTVYSQAIIKWRARTGTPGLPFVRSMLSDPWIISAMLAMFLSAVSWMLALSALPLSHAYPFISLSFIILLYLSGLFFAEPITLRKVIGACLIVVGVAINGYP